MIWFILFVVAFIVIVVSICVYEVWHDKKHPRVKTSHEVGIALITIIDKDDRAFALRFHGDARFEKYDGKVHITTGEDIFNYWMKRAGVEGIIFTGNAGHFIPLCNVKDIRVVHAPHQVLA